MKAKIDYEGDRVWVVENSRDVNKILKVSELQLCICGICGEYYYNDSSLLDHFEMHNAEKVKRK